MSSRVVATNPIYADVHNSDDGTAHLKAYEFLHTFDFETLKEYDVILNEHDNEWDMWV